MQSWAAPNKHRTLHIFTSGSFSWFRPWPSLKTPDLHIRLLCCTANCQRGHLGLCRAGDLSPLLLALGFGGLFGV